MLWDDEREREESEERERGREREGESEREGEEKSGPISSIKSILSLADNDQIREERRAKEEEGRNNNAHLEQKLRRGRVGILQDHFASAASICCASVGIRSFSDM